jgi:hypothetical protein
MICYPALDIFCFIAFAFMSVICALGAISGYGNSRDIFDKAVSIVLGFAFSYGFLQLAGEALDRLKA